MASFISAAVGALSKDLTVQEALSGIFGSVSLATWMFLLVSLRKDEMRIYSFLGKIILISWIGTAINIELQDWEC